jgi:hypothetical protein
MFFIDKNNEVWFLFDGYLDGVAIKHDWEQFLDITFVVS